MHFRGGVHFTNNNSIVDTVELKSNSSSTEELGNLAIMLGDKNNNYTESELSTFPSNEKYSFNPFKSGCIDSSGNAINDSILFANNIASIKTNATSYCYLYFDYVSLTDCNGTIGECLMDNPTFGLNTTLEGELYRYQGEAGNVNNYVCFGTTSKEECLSDTDKYMYRVIGINEDNQVKLIKKESLNDSMQWSNDETQDVTWPNSIIYSNINGEKYLLNDTYFPDGWRNLVVNNDWKYGDIGDELGVSQNGVEVSKIENNWNDVVNAKIGLMYVHDYYLAYNNERNYRIDYDTIAWIHLANNDLNPPHVNEWMMSRYDNERIWRIGVSGIIGNPLSTVDISLRPTFFLTSDMQYKSGTGSIENPIILDTNPLVVNKVEASTTTSSSITLNITTNDNNLVDTYYYKCGDSVEFLESSSNTPTCSGLNSDTSYNISIYVKDKFGKLSETKTVSLKTQSALVATHILTTLKPSGLSETMEGGLYRFQGTTANNYVCFGTSDKETCTKDTDKYMYRIMGINANGELKLIKKEALNTLYEWDPSSGIDVSWKDSGMFSGLNSSYFLNNTTYVPSGWSEKIATTTWKYGDDLDVNKTALELYEIENSWSNTVDAKIGLMYLHDYYYGMSGGNNCSLTESNDACKSSWLFLWNSGNDSSATNATYEWTMSRHTLNYKYCGAWAIPQDGRINAVNFVKTLLLIRPVFYLTSNIQYISGTGTLSDPIIIN